MKEVLKIPLKATLYRHQQSACRFACERFGILPSETHSNGVALLMEMGCGKTITSIAIVGILYQYRHIRRILITAPLSILSVWEQEFARFAAFPYQLTVLKGSSTQKKEQLSKLHGNDLQIAVVNYESAWRLEKELLAFDADLIIADEAHKIKENRTAQSKAMRHLGDKSRYKLLLTGTLITNKELDVFSQYRFLNKEIFGTSFYAFRSRYFDMCGYGNHIPVFRKQMMDEFLQKLHSVAYRVTKAECLDLPQITEEIRTVELEPKAMKLYKQLEKECFAELAGSEISAVNVLTKMLRLSQMTGGYLKTMPEVSLLSAQQNWMLCPIFWTPCLQKKKKLVILARFVPELDGIQELLKRKQIGYASVRGGVSNRAEEIRRFQEDADCCVFVGQIAAAGLGITLTAASTMVFYSLDYSMSNFEQAKARIHRVSQTENCLYIYLTAKHTVDTKILRALRDKADLAKMLVDDYRNGSNPFQEGVWNANTEHV
ncbi:DEAD/DEAH box helicase [Ruminococcus sp.]|uniref:DEAD/DEAH box helicase n=1 Tax=Ruminococcus sp. TaxID=41978 RepID=UPI003994AC4C